MIPRSHSIFRKFAGGKINHAPDWVHLARAEFVEFAMEQRFSVKQIAAMKCCDTSSIRRSMVRAREIVLGKPKERP